MKNDRQFVLDTMKNVYGVNELADELFMSDDDSNEVDGDKVKALFVDYDKKKVAVNKTKFFDQGAQSREKKIKEDTENLIKSRFGITTFDGDGLESLIDHAVSLKPAGALKDLTPDQIEALPHVVGIKNKFQQQLTAKEQEFNEKLTAKEQEEAQKQLFGKIAANAIQVLGDKNAVLPEDEAKADRRIKKDLIEELNAYGWIEQNGLRIPIGKDGKQLETANGVLISEEDLITSIINENFEFKEELKAPPRTSPQDKNKGPKPDKAPEKEPYTGALPNSPEQYSKMMADRSLSLDMRKSMQRQYKKKNGII